MKRLFKPIWLLWNGFIFILLLFITPISFLLSMPFMMFMYIEIEFKIKDIPSFIKDVFWDTYYDLKV